MRPSIDYKFVAPGSEDFSKIQEFAKSFDHEIVPNAYTNVYAHFREGRLFGYSDHIFIPVVYPAFHPEFTTPRDVIDVMRDWKAATQLSGKPGHLGVPFDNRGGLGNFPEETMSKLGLVRLHRELYKPA